ncbi:hypothetical protein [Symbiobacterium terraclitae]|uniref:hypothetical protein n=1 Tax=Symbiobacterium terraclitae TaxID=557451 RepID=UPI0035B4FBBC
MRRWIVMGLVALVLVPVVGLGVLYYRYASLEVYEWVDGIYVNVARDGIVYEPSQEISEKVASGELVPDRVIGRFKGDHFLGFKSAVIRLQGIDERDGFLVRGLMFESGYARKD